MRCEICGKKIGKDKGEPLILVRGNQKKEMPAHYGFCFKNLLHQNIALKDEGWETTYKGEGYRPLTGGSIAIKEWRTRDPDYIRDMRKQTKQTDQMERWFNRLTRIQKYNLYYSHRKRLKLVKYQDTDEDY